MDMNKTQPKRSTAFLTTFITILFCLISYSPLVENTVNLDFEENVSLSDEQSDSTFKFNQQLSGQIPSTSNTQIIQHPGYRMDEGEIEINVENGPIQSTQGETFSANSLGQFSNTSFAGNAISLNTSVTGPPNAGNASLQLFSTVSWSGVKRYDTLELRCGIQSCGIIQATGYLELVVNNLIIESGSSITSIANYQGGTGVGTSTVAASNGRSDGAGGAGHGAAGGAGGGTAGGSGGSAYGNGSENGSAGGSVTSANHATATGGSGGGVIKIYAANIYLNGSIQADGAHGDNGNAPTGGTGAGGSGAGGGSAGTINITTNTLFIGSWGSIQSIGGSGGDGADGAQNGPGFGMYDGGDGGGGGSGGRVTIYTTQGGFTGSNGVNVRGGYGGAKGLKYGTGVDGVDGYDGGNGTFLNLTWTGYVAQTNITTNEGSYTSEVISSPNSQVLFANITNNYFIPNDSTLTFEYRYTVNGTVNSFVQWSDWTMANISQTLELRLSAVQMRYSMLRNGSQSPEIISYSIDYQGYQALENLSFSYRDRATSYQQQSGVGLIENSLLSGSLSSYNLQIPIQVGSTITEDLHLWMDWDVNDINQSMQVSIDNNDVVNIPLQQDSQGYSLVIPNSFLQSYSSANTYQSQGLEWNDLNITFQSTTDISLFIDHVHAITDFAFTANISTQVNDYIIDKCGSVYISSTSSCNNYFASEFTISGNVGQGFSNQFTFIANDPSFSWIDDYAPQLQRVEHRIGTEVNADIRVGDSFTVVAFDQISETNLNAYYFEGLVQLDALQNPSNGATSMSYHSGLQGYWQQQQTAHLQANQTHSMTFSVYAEDINNNHLTDQNSIIHNMTIHPKLQSISQINITSEQTIQGTDAFELSDGTNIDFAIKEVSNRHDLTTSLELMNDDVLVSLPLNWNPNTEQYEGQWNPQISDLGSWSGEIIQSESDGLQQTIATPLGQSLILIDTIGPVITTVSFTEEIEVGQDQFISFEWLNSTGETMSGSISIFMGNTLIDTRTVLPNVNNNASTLFSTTNWSPGIYDIQLDWIDQNGNTAVDNSNSTLSFTVLAPWHQGNHTVIGSDNATIIIEGDYDFRSTNGLLTITSDSWQQQFNITDEAFSFEISILEIIARNIQFTTTICDQLNAEMCVQQNFVISFEDIFVIDVDSLCFDEEKEFNHDQGGELFSCRLLNNGLLDVVISIESNNYNASYLTQSTSFNLSTETIQYSLYLENDSIPFNQTTTFSIIATLDGQSQLIDSTSVNFVREAPPQQIINEGEETKSETTSNSQTVTYLIAIALLMIVIGAVTVVLRKREEDLPIEDLQLTNQEMTGQAAQISAVESQEALAASNTFVPSVQPIEDLQQSSEVMVDEVTADETIATPNASITSPPNANTKPTSVDANGYEWYSEGESHWYRTEGSQSDWYKHIP